MLELVIKRASNNIFKVIKNYSWIFTLAIGIGGLYYPKLGLLVLPVIVFLIITSFFTGRFWCGNICSHGSLFDNIFKNFSLRKGIPNFLKTKTASLIIFTFFIFQIGRRLFNLKSHFGKITLLDRIGFIFVITYLVVTIVGGIAAVFFSPRSWCQVCPMGTMQIISAKLGNLLALNRRSNYLVTISDQDQCRQCGVCAKNCPMELQPQLEFNQNDQFNSTACIRCGECLNSCPLNILSLELEEHNNLDKI
ncbi:4Fe-4S binding protein [Halanaerobium salsuginis]|jgi:polyferredoxin|uniref:4Fe-4S binding domain-containing protein n=1 Tax=Halanaerobium salsuginis TaxID=29563 RepID=A0A1I4MJX2_9FIRM|nr:4Fe-4S binding protein [Halanaerobium salsuginis]SFM03519.1 4Fe-4S binding domain-containing protein [Halanaerobium salsuginis]